MKLLQELFANGILSEEKKNQLQEEVEKKEKVKEEEEVTADDIPF